MFELLNKLAILFRFSYDEYLDFIKLYKIYLAENSIAPWQRMINHLLTRNH